MTIGIIGSGEMGSCLASKLVKLQHTVAIANSRSPASLQQLAEETGAVPVTVEDAVREKDVVIVSIPEKNIPALPANLFRDLPQDVVVIDTGNYYPTLRDGVIPFLEQHGVDSLWVQQQLGIPVIKVFNSILATSLRDLGKPRGEKDRVAIAVSGDSIKAKEIVFKLVDELGFDPFDMGPVAGSWKQQPGSPVYCRDINFAEMRKRVDAIDPDWSVMHEVLIAKRKADEALMAADYPTYLEGLH
ncbi:MAG: NAD(P)-binding domain-containing protein [Chitinophagaceae bacterium]